MKCAEVLLKLADYSYQETSIQENVSIEAHLDKCLSCQKEYKLILKENAMFFDYQTNVVDIDVSPKLWENVKQNISQPNLPRPITTTSSSVIRPTLFNNLSLLTTPSFLSRLTSSLLSSYRDFVSNPVRFFEQLFQIEDSLRRDEKYWRVGKTVAVVLWLFSAFSYVSILQEIPKGFSESKKLTKIIDLSPLPFPQNLTKNPSTGNNNTDNSSSNITNKNNVTSKNSIAKSKPVVLPNVLLPGELPSISGSGNDFLTLANKNLEEIPANGSGNGGGIGSGIGSGSASGTGNTSSLQIEIVPAEEVYNIKDTGVIPPRILSKKTPSYTKEAIEEKIEGVIILSVIFATDSSVKEIKIIQGLGYGLDEEAIKAASQIKFIPATKDGKLVNVRARLEYTLNLF
ncbi:MAG: energy transducer TonB [Acidobacteria bacterium]|nr:energy transducer TonB [Acidobacteriota bacterium]